MINEKSIGIFWVFENRVFSQMQKLQDIKPINSFQDSDLSHYQVWDIVKNQHPKFYLYTYEEIPRGRVVYDITENRFIIYCNEYILKDDISKRLILEKFQLSVELTIFKKDEHYDIS